MGTPKNSLNDFVSFLGGVLFVDPFFNGKTSAQFENQSSDVCKAYEKPAFYLPELA